MTQKRFKVLWTGVAESDLVNIIDYIRKDNISNAQKIFTKIKERALTLDRFPERGRMVPELKELGIPLYREIIITPWRLIYRISEKKIYVLAVLDSRQNVEDILFQRLINQEF